MYVACGELLLGADYGSAALCGVQSAFAFDGCLSCCYAGPADFAADLGDVLPVVGHCGGGTTGGCGARDDVLVSRSFGLISGLRVVPFENGGSRLLAWKEERLETLLVCAHKHGDSLWRCHSHMGGPKRLGMLLRLHVSIKFGWETWSGKHWSMKCSLRDGNIRQHTASSVREE